MWNKYDENDNRLHFSYMRHQNRIKDFGEKEVTSELNRYLTYDFPVIVAWSFFVYLWQIHYLGMCLIWHITKYIDPIFILYCIYCKTVVNIYLQFDLKWKMKCVNRISCISLLFIYLNCSKLKKNNVFRLCMIRTAWSIIGLLFRFTFFS